MSRIWQNLFETIATHLRRDRSVDRALAEVVVAPSDKALEASLMEGLALQKSGDLAAAEACYAEILRHSPGEARALNFLAIIASTRGDFDLAEDLLRDALSVCPGNVGCLNTLGTVLSATGRHAEAAEVLRAALRLAPETELARKNLLFLLNLMPGVSKEELAWEHIEWARRHVSGHPALPEEGKRRGGQSEDGRLRIGYVSADFSAVHPVGRIVFPVLKSHDQNVFDVFCYDNSSGQSDLGDLPERMRDRWVRVQALDDAALAERIRADGIDILVDLSGHTRGGRMHVFARRPAPVQVAWLGYLSTTGLKAMNWRITESMADPAPQAQKWHVERLWYLPDCLWPWTPPGCAADAEVGNAPCMASGHVTFGSFNSFRKINPEVLAIWAELLRAVPEARLRIYGVPQGHAVDRLYDRFESLGVDVGRIDLLSLMEYDRYMLAYREVDIALDTFPYSGGATTCESLWMGVPVVTLSGEGGFSRTSASFLNAIGLRALVTETPSVYVRTAATLAADPARVASLRHTLRHMISHSPVHDVQRFTRALEDAYRAMWQEWCAQQADHGSVRE
jgi:predicted O-linked N-acetylglucosamine transferase (SPINDLY family)